MEGCLRRLGLLSLGGILGGSKSRPFLGKPNVKVGGARRRYSPKVDQLPFLVLSVGYCTVPHC